MTDYAMAWRLVEVPDSEARAEDLSNEELVSIRIMLAQHMGEPLNDMNVYYRAWEKLRSMVHVAMDAEDYPPPTN